MTELTHHLGSYALPSGSAIGVWLRGTERIYSQPVAQLSAIDRVEYDTVIEPQVQKREQSLQRDRHLYEAFEKGLARGI